MFKYKVDVPTPDGKSVEPYELSLRDVSQIPVGVLRKNRHNFENLMWATFEWGLDPDQMELFDRLPMSEMTKVLDAWQASGEADEPEDVPDDGDDKADDETEGELAEVDTVLDERPEPASVKPITQARKKKG